MMQPTVLREDELSRKHNRGRDPVAVLLQGPRGRALPVAPPNTPICPRGPIYLPVAASPGDGDHTDEATRRKANTAGRRGLAEAALEILGELDEDALTRKIVEHAAELVGASAGTLYLYDPDRESFRLRGDDGTSGADHSRDAVCGEELNGRLLGEDQDVVTAWCDDPDPGCQSPTERTEKAGIALRWRAQLLGVLVMRAPRVFSRAELDVLRQFTGYAATALRNARVVRSLQDVNELKDAVIGVAAHDLRGPLTHLTGYLELLIRALGPLDGCRATWLRIIEESVERMGELIDGILSYRRLSPEAGRQKRECCLNTLVAEVVADSETSAAGRSQELAMETAPDEVKVTGDPVLLREAIRNVVSNAIKYTPRRGRVTVKTALRNSSRVVMVEDTGPGIPVEERERVFRPFVRLASARGEEGIGLGLSLVKTIIEQHGGRVALGDTAAGGSVFSILLPGPEATALSAASPFDWAPFDVAQDGQDRLRRPVRNAGRS